MKRALAKQLRTQMTDAERRLWYRLRGHRFQGYKFKRQAPIGPYVVDFICFDRGLIIEVDVDSTPKAKPTTSAIDGFTAKDTACCGLGIMTS